MLKLIQNFREELEAASPEVRREVRRRMPEFLASMNLLPTRKG
jgi:hypothetical protein